MSQAPWLLVNCQRGVTKALNMNSDMWIGIVVGINEVNNQHLWQTRVALSFWEKSSHWLTTQASCFGFWLFKKRLSPVEIKVLFFMKSKLNLRLYFPKTSYWSYYDNSFAKNIPISSSSPNPLIFQPIPSNHLSNRDHSSPIYSLNCQFCSEICHICFPPKTLYAF